MKDFLEILGAEIISITIAFVAGLGLAGILSKIVAIPGLLIFLPGFLALKGNISGTLASKLGTALHLGFSKAKLKSFLLVNVAAKSIAAIAIATFLGLASAIGSWLIFGALDLKIIAIALIAATISNLVMLSFTVSGTLGLFKIGINPDDVMGPYITTIGDIVSIASLAIVLAVL